MPPFSNVGARVHILHAQPVKIQRELPECLKFAVYSRIRWTNKLSNVSEQ